MINLTLPYPPSVNHYLGKTGTRVYVKQAGKKYISDVCAIWMTGHGKPRLFKPLYGRLGVNIHVYPPDKRRRDIDNVLKVMLDSLTKAGVWEDDELIDRLYVERKEVIGKGKIEISIGLLSGN